MIAKRGISDKRKILLAVVAGIALVLTLVFVYFGFIRQSDIDLDIAGAGGLLTPRTGQINTSFDTEIFADPRMQNLQQHGPAEIQVQGRGRKIDPFEPF